MSLILLYFWCGSLHPIKESRLGEKSRTHQKLGGQRDPKAANKSQRQLSSQLLMEQQEDQAAHQLQICIVPRSIPGCSLVSDLVAVSPHGPRLVDAVGFLVVSLNPLPPSILPSSTCLPDLHLMFGCETLHLFPLSAG